MHQARPFLLALLFAGLVLAARSAPAHCRLADEGPTALSGWKASGFALEGAAERNARALALVDCLEHPDPSVRDGIAFEALSTWMRGDRLDVETLRTLSRQLQERLQGAGDDAGFRKPFAALVLSEVARTDRVRPWMTPGERGAMVDAAAGYLRSVRDYRGYVDGEGWRHGVAHGADWAMQLALNKAVTPDEAMSLLAALGAQAAPPDGHAYAFGEPVRLARAAAYASGRGDLDPAAVEAWLVSLPASLGAMPEDGRQAAWWARRADLENFLYALGALVGGGQSPALVATAAGVGKAIQALP